MCGSWGPDRGRIRDSKDKAAASAIASYFLKFGGILPIYPVRYLRVFFRGYNSKIYKSKKRERSKRVYIYIYNTRHADERIIYDDGSLLVHQARICHRAHRSPASPRPYPHIHRAAHIFRAHRPDGGLFLPESELPNRRRRHLIYFHFSFCCCCCFPPIYFISLFLFDKSNGSFDQNKEIFDPRDFSPPASTCAARSTECHRAPSTTHQIISKRNDDTTRQPPFTCRKASDADRRQKTRRPGSAGATKYPSTSAGPDG